ncbi:MAG TPA: hypothetical protein VIH21_07700 [Dehalococcoidia bacterium]
MTAAKCIDNETLYQDSTGDWHVVGEIHNETDVWGAGMVLLGQLLDAEGNVIATTQAPVCPLELAAHSFDAFDLHFRQSSSLHPASYKINVKEGRALEAPLPDSGLSLEGFKAKAVADGINISGNVGSTRTYDRVLTGCIAFYNASGRVVTHVTAINFGLTLPLEAGSSQPVAFTVPFVQPDATSIRLWLAGDSDTPLASDYAAVMTGTIPIQ